MTKTPINDQQYRPILISQYAYERLQKFAERRKTSLMETVENAILANVIFTCFLKDLDIELEEVTAYARSDEGQKAIRRYEMSWGFKEV